jgi:pyrroline-5-carboxylate reductase
MIKVSIIGSGNVAQHLISAFISVQNRVKIVQCTRKGITTSATR